MTYVKDMALNLADFLRGLDAAMGGLPYRVVERRVTSGTPEKGIEIEIDPLPPRVLGGLLKVERSQVTLVFSGYGERERNDFLIRFDRAYQRGGG